MQQNSMSSVANQYFKRFGFREQIISSPATTEMKICLVIPCYDETGVLHTLKSLAACQPPIFPVEVLLVLNCGLHENEVRSRNRQSLREVTNWRESQPPEWLRLHTLWLDDLPPKHAGVGLARKIGMDEALRRFASLEYAGMIVCLDADCSIAPNYLQVLEDVQINHAPKSCTIYFEHTFEEVTDPQLQEGIIYYELFLRYYVNALAFSGYPYSMHTIGSGMAVRADIYALSGGMNRRKAGEDFYFLHKIAHLGDLKQIGQTCVFPSARLSDRVPFGTGKAQKDWLLQPQKGQFSYHFQTFEDLKLFLAEIPAYYRKDSKYVEKRLTELPETLYHFLTDQDFGQKIAEIKANSGSFDTFNKRFFSWFDGFKVLKFVHYCRDAYYKEEKLTHTSRHLLKLKGIFCPDNPIELLRAYRQLDKERQ
jgi:hypothetical protein